MDKFVTILTLVLLAGCDFVYKPIAYDEIKINLEEIENSNKANETGVISGQVTLENASDFSGVVVTVGDSTAETTSGGAYIISDLSVGSYNIVFEKEGYVTQALEDIEVKAGFIATVDSVELLEDLDDGSLSAKISDDSQ